MENESREEGKLKKRKEKIGRKEKAAKERERKIE